MPYTEEVRYLEKLESKGLVPKQLLNAAVKSNEIIISIEEFINAVHIPDNDPYNEKYMEVIIRSLAEFNSTEIIDGYNEYEKYNTSIILLNKEDKREKIKLIYLDYLINRLIFKAKRRFDEIINEFSSSLAEKQLKKIYFTENEQVFEKIRNFLNAIPEFFDKIIEKYSANKHNLVFSYIDFHTWNFFILGSSKIKFIDFEELSFALPGFDLANYMIESEYLIIDEKYPFYIHDANKFSDEFALEAFKLYVSILNKDSNHAFVDIGLDEIYRLLCLALIKTVVDYVFMFRNSVYLKNELDLIMLMGDRISRFDYFFNLIAK